MPVSYHCFYLLDPSPSGMMDPEPPDLFPNGLIATHPGIAAITTGIADGDVAVTVELYDQEPAVRVDRWDEVVEVSVEAPYGHMIVTALDEDLADALPELTRRGPGQYRIRVHALGRDTSVDLVAFDIVENYLIQAWPATRGSDTAHKHSDAYGASMRELAKNA